MVRAKSYWRPVWRNNGLSLALFALFAISLVGQSLAGWSTENEHRTTHGQPHMEFAAYLNSGGFLEVTMENWESEFLQMFIYVVFTVFLFQRGSSESKDPDHPEEPEAPITGASPAPVRAGGWRLALYAHSMSIAFLALFALSFTLHALGGVRHFNETQALQGAAAISVWTYIGTSKFWFESLQNWQSEFLSIWAMVVLSIVLRERGSPESKSVASSHHHTGR